MNVTGPCLHHFIMCQLIRAQLSCFTNGCSIYVYAKTSKVDVPILYEVYSDISGYEKSKKFQRLIQVQQYICTSPIVIDK